MQRPLALPVWTLTLLVLSGALLGACAHSTPSPTSAPAAATTTPAPAPSRLETTPRHDEWIEVRQGERTVRTYVVYPERRDKAPVVVVIHENRGLTDWVRTVADRLAEEGFLALAPDLLSGAAPGGGGTRDFPTQDAAREAISGLPRAQVMADLAAVIAEARAIPAASGKVFVAGFCWGGGRTWEVANQIDGLAGAFVFYGTGPKEPADAAGIDAPVYGFYGSEDARVNTTIAKSQELVNAIGQTFEPVVYDGAGHGFLRAGEEPDASEGNRKASEAGWKRWLELLRKK